ncbi:MAG TPA: hypothetical protein VHN11_04885 [Xanthobacteraceae bacterium]|jgi:hypothetical protein|nr:hypothetical protein [Xanthobacteraceae bacterium]
MSACLPDATSATQVWPIDMDTLPEDELEAIALDDLDRNRRRKAINLLRMREFRDGLAKMSEIITAVGA